MNKKRINELRVLSELKPAEVTSTKLVKTKKYTNKSDGVKYRDELWQVNGMEFELRYLIGKTDTTKKLMKFINWQAGQELYSVSN